MAEYKDPKMLKLSVTPSGTLPSLPLPSSISEDYINCKSSVGLSFHILESGYDPSRPLILLLHEFPGLAYSWRKIMPALASANNYVVAVDQRGYGRTTGWEGQSYEATNLDQFTMKQYVSDMVALVYGLGYKQVRCIIGHDFGASVAAYCALMRPDFFRSCILISTPFNGFEGLPTDMSNNAGSAQSPVENPRERLQRTDGHLVADRDVHFAMAQLVPPRKHYRWYNSFPSAASEYRYPPQGLHSFLRGYFQLQSADCNTVQPTTLLTWTAAELAKLPNYYIMPLYSSMPEVVAADMDSESYDKSRAWLEDDELAVYVQEYSRTGFQGALNYFRVDVDPERTKQLTFLAGARIEVPVIYISGAYDWGRVEDPGVLQLMPSYCKDFRGAKLIKGSGHWPQQEQPGALVAEILSFLWDTSKARQKARAATSEGVGVGNARASSSAQSQSKAAPQVKGILPPRQTGSPAQLDRSIAGQLQRRTSESQSLPFRGRADSGENSLSSSRLPSESNQQNNDARKVMPQKQPELKTAKVDTSVPTSSSFRSGYEGSTPSRRKPNDPDTPHPDIALNDNEFPSVSPPPPPLISPISRPNAPTPDSYADQPSTPHPGYRQTFTGAPSSVGQRERQAEPLSPVAAIDASELNAEIYKKVSEQARRRLEDAEKQFRRMGREVKTRDYAADDSKVQSRGNETAEKKVRRTSSSRAASGRKATPFEADMEVGPPTPGLRLLH